MSHARQAGKRGLLGDLLRFRRAHLPTLLSAWHECGDLFRLRLGPVSPHFAVHPDSVQHVLLGNAKNYNKQTRGFIKLKLALGEGLLTERFKEQHRFAYLPFGAGARMCIGSNFAMMEAQLVLASIVQRYRLDLVPGHPVELEPLITLRSRRGMRMTATPVDRRLS